MPSKTERKINNIDQILKENREAYLLVALQVERGYYNNLEKLGALLRYSGNLLENRKTLKGEEPPLSLSPIGEPTIETETIRRDLITLSQTLIIEILKDQERQSPFNPEAYLRIKSYLEEISRQEINPVIEELERRRRKLTGTEIHIVLIGLKEILTQKIKKTIKKTIEEEFFYRIEGLTHA